MGYTLRGEGRMLLAFADRLDRAGQETVTVSAALSWATEPKDVTSAHWSRWLGVVRVFTRHLHTLDPSCEIPPVDLLPGPSHRPPPYIYAAEEIAALVHAADTIAAPMHAATCQGLYKFRCNRPQWRMHL